MPTERASVFESTRIGIESVPGTGVAASKMLLSTSIEPGVSIDVNTYRPRGSRFNTISVANKEWSAASVTQEVASYTDPAYLFSNIFGSPSISTPGGATSAREQLWDPGLFNFTAVTPKTFTVETGSFTRAQKFSYGLITGIGMDYDRDGVSLSGDMIGQKITDGITLSGGTSEGQTITITGAPTGGTFTLTFMGETTGTIAYDAEDGDVETALLALPNIDTGDVACTGGDLPGTPVVVTFGGKYAKLDIPMMTVDDALLSGGTTPAAAITESAAGAPLTSLDMVPISGNQWDIYADTAGASIGSTKLTRCFNARWSVSDMFGPVWVGNTANPSWVAHVDMAPGTEFRMSLEADSTGMSFLDDLRAGDKLFIRLDCTGPEIESGQNHMLRSDLCVQLTDISEYGDTDGVISIDYTGEIAYDATWGTALKLAMRNDIAAIS